jgi:hypothetical protein
MNQAELVRRLEAFLTEQPVDRVEISENSLSDFQVELTLKPNTPIAERFILRLETALAGEIGSLSLFRVRTNVMIVRFTLRRSAYDDPSGTDRIAELPSVYTTPASRTVPLQAAIRGIIAA